MTIVIAIQFCIPNTDFNFNFTTQELNDHYVINVHDTDLPHMSIYVQSEFLSKYVLYTV